MAYSRFKQKILAPIFMRRPSRAKLQESALAARSLCIRQRVFNPTIQNEYHTFLLMAISASPNSTAPAFRQRQEQAPTGQLRRRVACTNRRTRWAGPVDAHEEVPAVRDVERVRDVPSGLLRAEIGRERTVVVQLDVRAVDPPRTGSILAASLEAA
jgi:hypothetical protein